MKKNFLQILKIITLGIILSVGVGFLIASNYTSPGLSPLAANIIDVPINATNSSQAKGGSILSGSILNVDGTLSASSLAVLQSSTIQGESKIKLSQLAGTGRRSICRDEVSGSMITCPVVVTRSLLVNKTGAGSGSVISNPQGINCASPGCTTQSYDFETGTVITLVATVSSGSFTGWSGGTCSGTNTTCTFTINTNVTVNAAFGGPSLPLVSTNGSFTNTTQNGSVGGGTVTTDGGASVTERGVAWAVFPTTPTIAMSHSSDGVGLGSFVSNIINLTSGTSYYVRAYATNSQGTGYGSLMTFISSPGVPSLSTTAITGATQTTAVSGGNTISDGGAPISVKGVVWSIYQNPTTSDSKTTNGSGSSNFTSNLSGLTAYTTYYVRAYATNVTGTGYGNQLSFTTQNISCGGTIVAGYCWYLNPTQNQNCNIYCASRGGCKSVSITYAQETQVCGALGMGSPGGGSGSTTPNTDGGWCYVQGTTTNTGPFSNNTCSSSLAWRKNACSCNL